MEQPTKVDVIATVGEFILKNSPTDNLQLQIEIEFLFHEIIYPCPSCMDD